MDPVLWRIALEPRLGMTMLDVERMTVPQVLQALAVLGMLAEQDLRRAAAAAHDRAQAEAAARRR